MKPGSSQNVPEEEALAVRRGGQLSIRGGTESRGLAWGRAAPTGTGRRRDTWSTVWGWTCECFRGARDWLLNVGRVQEGDFLQTGP